MEEREEAQVADRCQSCGTPLSDEGDNYGSEMDESRRMDYCSYCYDMGSFTMPELTVSDMIDMSAEHMVMHLGMAPAEAAEQAKTTIQGLDRWRDCLPDSHRM